MANADDIHRTIILRTSFSLTIALHWCSTTNVFDFRAVIVLLIERHISHCGHILKGLCYFIFKAFIYKNLEASI